MRCKPNRATPAATLTAATLTAAARTMRSRQAEPAQPALLSSEQCPGSRIPVVDFTRGESHSRVESRTVKLAGLTPRIGYFRARLAIQTPIDAGHIPAGHGAPRLSALRGLDVGRVAPWMTS